MSNAIVKYRIEFTSLCIYCIYMYKYHNYKKVHDDDVNIYCVIYVMVIMI